MTGQPWNENEGKFDKPSSGVPKPVGEPVAGAAAPKPDKPKRTRKKVLDTIAEAAANPHKMPDMRSSPHPADASDGGYDADPLGPECPVQALGFYGQRNYFLDHAYQLIELGTEFRKGECMGLFGTKLQWLKRRWPTWKEVTEKGTGIKEWKIIGFDQKEAQEGLIMACAQRGLFDPSGKVRGRGAHVGDDGSLHLHCGNGVLIGGRRGPKGEGRPPSWEKPGLVAGYVYPAFEKLERPSDNAAPTHIGEQVLALLQTWNWRRPNIDPYLLFCWIAVAQIGGALKWRPHAWITGPSGAGKSTLQELIARIMGHWAIRTEDATEAGVRQLLSQDTLAVCFDEIEPDEGDGSAHHKIIKLARLASSGGSALRGSQDHKSKQFVAKSCFLFSSIHHHELPLQDRNRIAILSLAPFPSGTVPLVLPETLADWGAQIRRRLIEQWPRFQQTLLAYQEEMLRQRTAPREQEQYGALLAAGDLLLYDRAPPSRLAIDQAGEPNRCAELVARLANVLDAQRTEGEDVTSRCVHALTSYRLPAAGGTNQETVGQWLTRAFVEAASGAQGDQAKAQHKLSSHGIRLMELADDHHGQSGLSAPTARRLLDLYVAVAGKSHRGVADIFSDTMWRNGVWAQSLSEIDGAFSNKKARFGGSTSMNCVIVPLVEFIDVEAAAQIAKEQGATIA